MDGFEAVAAIRAAEQARGTRTPVLALTAFALDRATGSASLAAGFDDHLTKPVSIAHAENRHRHLGWAAPRRRRPEARRLQAHPFRSAAADRA